MKPFLVLLFIAAFAGCSDSSNSGGGAEKTGSPIALSTEFGFYETAVHVTANSYAPRVAWVLNTPLTLESLPPTNQDVAIIFNDGLAGANGELTKLAGIAQTSNGTRITTDTRDKIEKLNSHTWRIVLHRSTLNDLARTPNASEIYYVLNYSVPASDVPQIFSPVLGLQPKIETSAKMVMLGQVKVPIGKGIAEVQQWRETHEAAVKTVKEKLENYTNETVKGRSLSGERRLQIGGKRISIEATVTIEGTGTCVVDFAASEILKEQGTITYPRRDIQKKVRANCQVLANQVVIENIGRLDVYSYMTVNTTPIYQIYLKKEIFAGETLGLLQELGREQEIALEVLVGLSL